MDRTDQMKGHAATGTKKLVFEKFHNLSNYYEEEGKFNH